MARGLSRSETPCRGSPRFRGCPGQSGHFTVLRDEGARGIAGAVVVEIVVAALVVADEPLRLVRQREQPLGEPDGDHVVLRAVHDQQRDVDLADPSVGAQLVLHQPAHRHVGKHGGRDVDRGRVGRLEDQLADRPLGREPRRDAGAEGMTPQDDALRRIARDRERVGGRGVAMQALLGRRSGRAAVAAEVHRDQSGAVGDGGAVAFGPPRHDLGIAVEVDDHRRVAARGHVPGDQLLAVTGREHDLLRFRHVGRGRGDVQRGPREQHRALGKIEHGHDQRVAANPDDQHPPHDRHGVVLEHFPVRRRKCDGHDPALKWYSRS